MLDQYFGIKELYEVVLKAKTDMTFGDRRLEAGEPVLYFEKINMAAVNEKSNVIMARGGWANMPRVIWEDRSEVSFSLSEGVLSSISFSILLNTKMMAAPTQENPLFIPKREGPMWLEQDKYMDLEYEPADFLTDRKHKAFIYEYDRDVGQQKYYGTRVGWQADSGLYRIEVHGTNKENLDLAPDPLKQYIIDYYYQYNKEALIYTLKKERFNGLFTLEGKFYAKDENEGINYTNLIYMPKVRVVSDINLRLGERANPTVGNFTMIGLPESFGDVRNSLILEITRLGEDIDAQ